MTKRHPGQRRVTSDSKEHEDDLFVARVIEIGNWLKANQTAVVAGLVVLAVAVFGAIYYGNLRANNMERAANQLEEIHRSLALGDSEGAKDALVAYIDQFGNTPFGGEGRMLLAEIYLSSGSAEQAMAVLERMAASPRDPLELQAAGVLAAAYEQVGRLADAEATYLRIADRSELSFQIRDALAAAARLRRDQGNTAGAAQLYQRLLDGLEENAPERGLWEMRLAEVQPQG